MKKLLAVVFVMVLYNGVGFYFLTHSSSSSPKSVAKTKTTKEINLSNYLADKGAVSVSGSSFGSVLNTPVVLGESKESTPSAPDPKTSAAVGKNFESIVKNEATVALLGDSMIDTLGPDLPHLSQILKETAPDKTFHLINYGVGASDIEYGLTRLTSGYTYLGQYQKPLLDQKPDVLVVESFAYNHWTNTQSDLDRQWLTIARIIDTVKAASPNTKIVLASTIAPYCPTYTDGSANLPQGRKQEQCATVKAYLQNMVNFATSQGYPLANAYQASLKDGEGNPQFINQSDHIHASDTGKQLFAQLVASQIIQLVK